MLILYMFNFPNPVARSLAVVNFVLFLTIKKYRKFTHSVWATLQKCCSTRSIPHAWQLDIWRKVLFIFGFAWLKIHFHLQYCISYLFTNVSSGSLTFSINSHIQSQSGLHIFNTMKTVNSSKVHVWFLNNNIIWWDNVQKLVVLQLFTNGNHVNQWFTKQTQLCHIKNIKTRSIVLF